MDQARCIGTFVAISGGMITNSDKLYELPHERVNILKSILPVYGKVAKPIDLFENIDPQIFNLKIDKDFDSWDILCVFNWMKISLQKRQ